ncbi:hypothetical protein [Arthrobacter sp.]
MFSIRGQQGMMLSFTNAAAPTSSPCDRSPSALRPRILALDTARAPRPSG